MLTGIGLSCLAVITAAGLARAQEQTFRTVETAPGKVVRIGLAGNVTKECTVGPMPKVKVVTQPSHGTLAIKSGKTKAGALARCPNLEVPAQGLFYQATQSSPARIRSRTRSRMRRAARSRSRSRSM